MHYTVALVGNPNVGKTAVFNALTGMTQNTANYPGVTVACMRARLLHEGPPVDLLDLPGAYSLAARSPDEMIVADILLGQQPGESPIDAILVVIDASNLQRNLYFVSQLLELNKPVVVALNMTDVAERRGLRIDAEALSEALDAPVVPIQAVRRTGIGALKVALAQAAREGRPAKIPQPPKRTPLHHVPAVEQLLDDLAVRKDALGRSVPPLEAYRTLVDQGGYAEQRLLTVLGNDFAQTLDARRTQAQPNGKSLAEQEAGLRYAWTRDVFSRAVELPSDAPQQFSEKLDHVLTHRVWGTLLFAGLMLLLFQSIFTWAGPFMDLIDGGIGLAGEAVGNLLPEGMLRSLVVDGIFAGVGGVLVFLPQILLLSLFIALLEDCGYMARAAFLMDKLLSWCGLNGQSFIPMLSSFACAVPAIAATRVIASRKDRFTTILVSPLMSCSARLPVYVIMIAAFVPATTVFGFLSLQALTLAGMYLVGVVVAIPIAFILKRTLLKGDRTPFLMEMPSYKWPDAYSVGRKVYREGREFIVRAGTLIFAVAILVWALAYFPRPAEIAEEAEAARQQVVAAVLPAGEEAAALATIEREMEGAYLRNSVLGQVGLAVEPVFRPLGWDWRIATATIASFPAREVIIATLGTLFNLGGDMGEDDASLRERLRTATWPDGSPLFNLPVALSVMVFFALCCQCAATLAAIKRETGSWSWPAGTFAYMTVLAYLAALVVYQGTMALGWGV